MAKVIQLNNNMDLYLYNSLTRNKDLFVPIDPSEVKFYTCGPTVYSYATIGHGRKYVMDDLNKRILEYQKLKETDIKSAMKLWREIVFDSPQNYNFLSTWTGNYENLRNVYHGRKNHKQREFPDFCRVIERLPYSQLITIERKR